MNRTAISMIATLVLGAGVVAGLAGCDNAQPGPTGPTGVVSSPSATQAPTGSGAPAVSTTPDGSPLVSPSPTPEPTPTPQPTPALVPAPLTGLPVKEAVTARHVVAVMVDDQSAARPQSGLSQADVVWQAPAEGGIPRYEAWFQSTLPTSVGPIRSARLYFVAWASEWRSVYAHAGGSPQALAVLNSSQGRGKVVYNADQFRYSKYLYRVSYRYAPHNVYSDAKSLRQLTRVVGAKPVTDQAPKWKFAPDVPLEQRPVGGKIVVPYLANRITYNYNRKTNTYPRSVSVEGKEYDVGTKPRTRIAPKNVVIMAVRFVPLNDKKHRLDGQVTGSGTAWISSNGKTVKGTWKKKSFTAPTRFYGPDGSPVILTMGQTFVQVVPRGTKISIKDGKVPVQPATPATSPSPTPSPTP